METILQQMTFEFLGTSKHKMSLEQLFASDKAFFLDVRDAQECEVLRFNLQCFGIPTLNIPINQLPKRLNELPTDRLIVCFCSSGTRSAWAYLYLLSKGYQTKWLEASNEDLAKLLKPGKIFKALQ